MNGPSLKLQIELNEPKIRGTMSSVGMFSATILMQELFKPKEKVTKSAVNKFKKA